MFHRNKRFQRKIDISRKLGYSGVDKKKTSRRTKLEDELELLILEISASLEATSLRVFTRQASRWLERRDRRQRHLRGVLREPG